jgi:hypothetical protein
VRTIRVSGSILLSTVGNFLDLFKLGEHRHPFFLPPILPARWLRCETSACPRQAARQSGMRSARSAPRRPVPLGAVADFCPARSPMPGSAAEAGKQLDIVRSPLNLPSLVADVHCIIEAMIGELNGAACFCMVQSSSEKAHLHAGT